MIGRMRAILPPALLLLAFASGLHAQSAEPDKPGGGAFLLELHQVTPGPGLRDINSRSGFGGMVGFEIGGPVLGARFVLEAGTVPTQFADPAFPGQTYEPVTWGGGIDGILHLGSRDLNAYALAGLHLDHWQTTFVYDSTGASDSSASTHLGLRLGAGLQAGPFFAEARYRLTAGDLRVPSDQVGSGGSWSAVEVGAGLRIRF